MTLALILLVVLLAGGAMLYLHDRFTHGEEKAPVRGSRATVLVVCT